LEALLRAVDVLGLTTPVFIKMPIELGDKEVTLMLEVILKHRIAGIIIGNLQKNRNDPALNPEEVAKFPVGNFSGKPTWKRSNELISLAYRHCGGKLVIIGCGGVFSAEDAYEKILRGASLVQLITGMIFQGPQLIAEINLRLPALLQRDGYNTVADAVGMMHYEK
jgi:dihydroorotate dehydrogenase